MVKAQAGKDLHIAFGVHFSLAIESRFLYLSHMVNDAIAENIYRNDLLYPKEQSISPIQSIDINTDIIHQRDVFSIIS